MWVKLTPVEISEAKKRHRRTKIRKFLIVWTCISAISSPIPSWTEFAYRSSISFYESIGRFLVRLTFGIPGVLLFNCWLAYRERKGYERTMRFICLKCGEIKPADGGLKCHCGGDLEDIDSVKWVAEKDERLSKDR